MTVQLIDTELGSVAVKTQVGGEPKEYKKIVGELSGALVTALDLGEEAVAAVEPEPTAAVEIDNDEADIILTSFSRAMNAVDKDNVEEVKENLQQVQKIDKTNEAVKYYLSELQSFSPKFRVETTEYTTPYNAATLGFIDRGEIYFWLGAPVAVSLLEDEDFGHQYYNEYIVMDSVLFYPLKEDKI